MRNGRKICYHPQPIEFRSSEIPSSNSTNKPEKRGRYMQCNWNSDGKAPDTMVNKRNPFPKKSVFFFIKFLFKILFALALNEIENVEQKTKVS